MKSKKLIYCLLMFCVITLLSCDKEKTDYTGKVVGDYDVKISPNLNVKYGGNFMSIPIESVDTKCVITEKDDEYVYVQMDGVNGLISEMFFEAYCDGLGMKLESSIYEGVLYSPEYGIIDCRLKLKNPTVSIYNSRNLSWESTVTGSCEINISGLDSVTVEVTGEIQFEAKGK